MTNVLESLRFSAGKQETDRIKAATDLPTRPAIAWLKTGREPELPRDGQTVQQPVKDNSLLDEQFVQYLEGQDMPVLHGRVIFPGSAEVVDPCGDNHGYVWNNESQPE